MKDCLDCKYEPDWSDPIGREYQRRSGKCKWDKPLPSLPQCYLVEKQFIVRFDDDSGIMRNCAVWEART
jgi:hypothetical protein